MIDSLSGAARLLTPSGRPDGRPNSWRCLSNGMFDPPNSPNKKACARQALLFGAPGMIRTCDPLVRSQVLYPAELRVLSEGRII